MSASRVYTARYGAEQVCAAYARLAAAYDYIFGPVLNHARRAAVSAVNALPGRLVLEVGVGTGLALPHYAAGKTITGIDLSTQMLRKARDRAAALPNVEAVLEMDAQATGFEDGRFDIAAAMFVASVVPDPKALMRELRRIVKPGGYIVIVNHIAAERGVMGWIERVAAPLCIRIGWQARFRLEDLLGPAALQEVGCRRLRPFGLFGLLVLKN